MIYIATHKQISIAVPDNYAILQVGAEGKPDFGYLRDNTGDSISNKNINFCELTGLYWIWKNRSDEYKGLVHYRRFFGKSNLSSKPEDIYSYRQLVTFLNKTDIVVPYIEYFHRNAKEEIQISCCTPEIWAVFERVFKSVYPDYSAVFDEYFFHNKSVLFNMMFCTRELFDAYAEWLFTLLFKLEKAVDLDGCSDYQKRLYGFLSERLLNIWIMHNGLKMKNVPVVNTEMKTAEELQLIRRRITNRICFAGKGAFQR